MWLAVVAESGPGHVGLFHNGKWPNTEVGRLPASSWVSNAPYDNVKDDTARTITEMAGSWREIRVAIKKKKKRKGIFESSPENLF